MINRLLEIVITLLVILIISLLLIDNFIENKTIELDSTSKEKMLAIAEDVERVEKEVEEKKQKEEEEQKKIEEQKKEEEEKAKKISYENLTVDEIAAKLDRAFNNELKGKGYLYASYSLSKGVNPYLAAAISLEETGCTWNCSSLVKNCHNVGGMKGSGCGEYGYFSDLDSGIKAFIDNIYKNYVLYGLTTADTMNPKYAENPLWARNVNRYIEKIKNN